MRNNRGTRPPLKRRAERIKSLRASTLNPWDPSFPEPDALTASRRRDHHLHPRVRALLALTAVVVLSAMAALACTANDTLFIQLTVTPTPTITPTPLAMETKFKIGDTGVVVSVSEFNTISLSPIPAPFRAGISTITCFPNTKVQIRDVSLNINDPNDKTVFYQVQCSGVGWLPEYQLSRFAKFDSAVVKSPDGKGAPLYSIADASGTPTDTCPDGTRVDITGVISSTTPTDLNIYVQVSCAGTSGYLVESLLAPVS